MVMTAFVLMVIRKDGPARVCKPVLMRRDSSSAVRRKKNCKGGKGGSEIGRDDDNLGVVGAGRGMVLPGKTRAGGRERVSRRDNEVEGR